MSTLQAIGVGFQASRTALKQARAERRQRALERGIPVARRILRGVLNVGGLSLFTAAAFTIALPAGLVVAGMSLLVLDRMVAE